MPNADKDRLRDVPVPAPIVCRECGATVMVREFHDYVECVRYRSATYVLGDSQPIKDVRALLAHIDQMEIERGFKRRIGKALSPTTTGNAGGQS